MYLSTILNLINLILLLIAAFLCFSRRVTSRLSKGIILILAGFFCLAGFRHLSNVLEWSGLYATLDVYEDYIRILEPMFFGMLFFAFYQYRLKSNLLESEARYRLIIEHQTDLVIKVNPEGKFLFVSPSYCRLFGKTEKELIGRQFADLIHKDDIQNTLIEWQKVFHSPYTCHVRQRAETSEGIRWLDWTDTAVLNPDGSIRAVVAMGRDITDRVQAEQERERLLKVLEIKNRDLQNIVYIASHDLQSPLVNIRGFAGELKRSLTELAELVSSETPSEKPPSDAIFTEAHESLHFIAASAEKMQSLIDGLLTISRIGTVELKTQTIDMNRLMNAVIKTIQFQIQQADAEVTVEDLPPCRSDGNQINHVFSNLLDNAVKYLHPDRPGRIRVWGEIRDGQCLYHVSDNGVGIPVHLHSKVYDLFYRLNPQGPAKGIGLGLTIVARILERLGGSISIDSTPGKGTTFSVSLPDTA